MLSIAPPYLDHALDLPLDFPLDTPLDVATFNDILARIKTCDPLVARDSRLIDSANTGRPILQGAALSFDGATQYGTTSILPTASGSLECYFKSDDTSGNKLLIGSESASNCFLGVSSGKLSGGIGGEWWVHILGTTTLQTGQWYHAKITWDGAIVKLYLDDIEDYSGAQVGSAVVGQAIYMACKSTNGTPTSFFDGTISNATINGTRYPLAEGAGSTAYSTSGNGNHATLIGNPTWVLEDGIPSSNLDDGFSKRMAFDGVNDSVTLGSSVTITPSDTFSLTCSMIFDGTDAGLFGKAGNFGLFLSGIGTSLGFTDDAGSFSSILISPGITDTGGFDIEITDDGSGNFKVLRNGVNITNSTVAISTFTFNILGYSRGRYLGGVMYKPSITKNGSLIHSYLGSGNQDSDWLDQIGSNNGTVTGGETLRIPAAEGSNSLDAVGGTLTNPAVSNGPHNDAETELDFYNIATDGGTTPAVLASGVVLTDYSFGQILLNPMFKRTISSVLEDRQTLFAAVLTGDCLEAANEYTI